MCNPFKLTFLVKKEQMNMAWTDKFTDFMDQTRCPRSSGSIDLYLMSENKSSKSGSSFNRSRSRSKLSRSRSNFFEQIDGKVDMKCEPEKRTRASSSSRSRSRSNHTLNARLQHDGFILIKDISNNMTFASIKGVVITRAGPKAIIPRKGSGNERYLVSMTVRDAPMSFINVSCWGNIEFANHIHSLTSVGDVVEIKDSQVQTKSNPGDEKFRPWTPSSCQLVVSENHGCITPYCSNDQADYAQLVYLPPRASNDFYTLEDVQAAGMRLQEEHINIMASVKKIWPKKSITTKKGQKTSKVDLILFDDTSLSFDLTLWDPFVDIVDRWVPMETVIFATDIKIVFSEYKSAMVAYSDPKSIFTTDPDTPEADNLHHFNKTQTVCMVPGMPDLGIFCHDGQDPDVESINDVLTIQDAKALLTNPDYYGKVAYGLVYATLTSFDLDGDVQTCVRNVCPSCWRTVHKDSGFVCINANCLGSDPLSVSRFGMEYNISVSLSDHGGTLDLCHLQPGVAKQLIGVEAQDFTTLTTFQRTAIKWDFLFERVKAVLKIKGGDGGNRRHIIKVLSMTKKLPDESL